jgi:replicative DNA helicase
VTEERVQPHDIEAERLVLASILLDDKAIHTAADILKPKDYYLESHRLIFSAMLTLAGESSPIDHWTVRSELDRTQKLEDAGGIASLNHLTDGIPRTVNLKHYCKVVRDRSTSRALIELGNRLMVEAWQTQEPPKKLLERIQTEMMAMYGRNDEAGLKPIADIVNAGYADLQDRKNNQAGSVVMTGFADIDRTTGGLRKDNLIILAARPSQGKSALAVNIAVNAARKGNKKVAIFSLEMSQTEIYDRMLASESGISCSRIIRGYIAKEDWGRIGDASGQLARIPMWIDDSGSISMLQIRSRAMKLAAEMNGIDLMIIDYLQLIQGPGKSIYERVTEISRALKILAKDMHVPVLALSQLHRLQDEAGEPSLSDLKESGAIEQDADMALFLWPSKVQGVKQFKIGKQRNGPLCSFNLGWEPSETRFFDCATDRTNDEQGLYQTVEEGFR